MKYTVTTLLAALALYVGSYVVLRSTIMHFGSHRAPGKNILWMYFGDGFGDGGDSVSRAASALYFPLIWIEYDYLAHE